MEALYFWLVVIAAIVLFILLRRGLARVHARGSTGSMAAGLLLGILAGSAMSQSGDGDGGGDGGGGGGD